MPSQKIPLEFAEWRPDIATLDTQFANEAENVFAGVNSYRPFPGLARIGGNPLPDPACGLYGARTSTGSWNIYAGTATKLYKWELGDWTDVSRTTNPAPSGPGVDYHVAAGDVWVFEQSGDHLVAVNGNDEPQWIEIDSGTEFENLPGDPPMATNVKQIGDFLFLSGLSGTTGTTAVPVNNRSIVWSSINDITSWTIGTSLCDMQTFPDGGPVQSVQGGEIGYVVQDRAIRTMQFLPGDTSFIFNFSRVLHDRGCLSKYGATCIGNTLYFVSEDGFYSVTGQQVQSIGADKVNDWWLVNSDVGRRNVMIALAGVNKPRIAWVFHKFSGSTMYDHQIIFDWSNGRWVHAVEQAQVWGLLASEDLDLDTTGSETNDAELDSPPDPAALSLDSFLYVGGRPLIAGIDEDGYLAALGGPNLAATIETAERHLAPGMRAFVAHTYPLVDGDVESVSVATRERLQDTPVWQAEVPIEITGMAEVLTSGRLQRFRLKIPTGTEWTHAQGVIADVQQDGTVA